MKRGFTIAELVLVMVIIATLAAILFPVLARSREATRSAACKTNLLNIFTALRIYAADFDGRFPPDPPGIGILASLAMLGPRTLQCPSAPGGHVWPSPGENPEEPSYIYVPNLRYPPLEHKMVVADARPRHNDAANVLYSDGAIRVLPVSRWLKAIPGPIGEAAGIFAPSMQDSGGETP